MIAPDWIAYHAKTSPGSVACIDATSGRKFTYRQLNERTAALTHVLISRFGVAKGDRIAVLSRNDTDQFEILFACQRAGAIFIPLNWRLTVAELEVIVGDAAPTVLFYSTDFRAAAEQLKSLVAIRHAVEMSGGLPSEYEEHIAETSPMYFVADRSAEDIYALLYTSGTTGRPKGAQITYAMALCNAIVLGSTFRLTAESRNLVVLPLFHTGGLNVFALPTFFHGGTNIVTREFDAELVMRMLKSSKFRVSHMLAVPTIHALLAAQPGFAEGWSIKPYGLCVAGAPCPVSTIQAYAERGLALRQCWGMTEAGPLALIMPYEQSPSKYGSSGMPNMFARTAIADLSGRLLPDGEIGELLVKGPVVTSGYWNRPDANKEAFVEGWFRTGDAAYRDADGYYYIVDRWKDMYISGGENIYPAEIERVLVLLTEVAECAVVPMQDEKWGEVGKAFIVLNDACSITSDVLIAHCEKHLARYKIPKQFRFIEALPRNATGKILKTRLRELA